jgi:hypothetical protein
MPQRNRKRWLWLLLIPAAILCVLILPFALIVGGHLAGALVGPVNVWNSTSRIPSEAEIAGRYQYSKNGSVNDEDPTVKISDDSGFTLGQDHDLEVHNLPKLDGFGKPSGCAYNGTGKWSLWGNRAGVMLDMKITTVLLPRPGYLPSCEPASFRNFSVLGKSRPYRFWYYIGDPDEGEGLVYRLR